MIMKKLSVITICYNEPNLEETCKSIVNQSWQDFEWIVIDGGSNKETLDIFEKYKYRIDKFVSESDNGIYNAMNKGIKLATAEYIAFMNAGDSYYNENSLQEFLNNGLDKDIIYSDIYFLADKPYIKKYPDILDKRFWFLDSLPHQATLVKRELFEKYGLYNEEYKIVSDYEKWLEFIYINKCSYKHLSFIGANFDGHGLSNNSDIRKYHKKERNEVLDKYFTLEEVEQTLATEKINYSFGEQIFSIKNHPDRMTKILTILGIHIKIRRNNK